MLFVVSAIIHVKYVPYCKCNRRLVLDVKLIHIIYIFWFILSKKYTLKVFPWKLELIVYHFTEVNKAWPPGDQFIRVPVLEKTIVAWV